MQCLAEPCDYTKSSWHLVTCKRWRLEQYITKMRTRENKIINLIDSIKTLLLFFFCSIPGWISQHFAAQIVCVDLNPIPGTRTWWSIMPMTSIAWWRLNFNAVIFIYKGEAPEGNSPSLRSFQKKVPWPSSMDCRQLLLVQSELDGVGLIDHPAVNWEVSHCFRLAVQCHKTLQPKKRRKSWHSRGGWFDSI